jgi:hypothetical protein
LISFFIDKINLAIVTALSWFLNFKIMFLKHFAIPAVASVISQGIKEVEVEDDS